MKSALFAVVVAFGSAAGGLGTGNAAQAQVCDTVPRNTLCETFDSPWKGNTSPDGALRLNGPWVGTGGNLLDTALAQFAVDNRGKRVLRLSVAAGAKSGSEMQSLAKPGYGYGYYEVRMRVTSVPGVCASFFWIEAPGYGPHEWDIEFLTNEPWVASANQGTVHLSLHPSNTTFALSLPFNPTKDFHRYGFLWTPGKIVFTVDGQAAHTFSEPDLTTAVGGFIMANTWTGNPNWGGGPPREVASTDYDWVRYTAGATSIVAP